MTGAAPLWELGDQLAPHRAALLVVDLQNDFTHPDGHLARLRGVDVTPVRRCLPDAARLVTGARRGGIPVIWLSVVHALEEEPPNYIAAQVAPPVPGATITRDDILAHRGTWGSAWDETLPTPLETEPCIEKPGYDGFHGTHLSTVLDDLQVKTLVFCGCNTNVCIQATASDGFARGFYTVLATDACASLDGPSAHEAAIATHRKYYGHAATTSRILGCWPCRDPRADSFPATP